MLGERYVVLGLASPRARWFSDVARWATSAAIPCEFVKCVSTEETRARLASGRAFSALVLDGGLPSIDRDLVDLATASGCAVVVVDVDPPRRNWFALGAVAVLADPVDRGALTDALRSTAVPIARVDAAPTAGTTPVPQQWQGRLVAVTGPPGGGASTVAMALAQGLAQDVRHGGLVVLADLALCADLAMLHDAGEVVPGVQELAEAHRLGQLSAEEVRALTFAVPDRGYRLLLGLRRRRDWAALRPRAFERSLESLRAAFRVVVADTDDDVEGESSCGSVDVEERNVMARTTSARADVVVVVGRPGPAGIFGLARSIAGLLDHGVEPERLQPVLSRPGGRRARAQHTRALADLLTNARRAPLATPIYIPRVRAVDAAISDGRPLPSDLATPVARSIGALLDRTAPPSGAAPMPVEAGTLGRWADEGIA